MNQTKFAIIGYGNIGKRHAEHILNNPEAKLTALCEVPGFIFPSTLPSHVKVFFDIEHFLHECNADVINVCTPNYLHCAHTTAALQKKYHVVCEKPMAMSSAECAQMIEAAQENSKTIYVVKQNRYNEPVQQIKKLLNENTLGKIFFININCFWNRNEHYYASEWRGKKHKDGGCLFTQFRHFVDILYYLFGEIKDCQSIIKNLNHPDIEIEDSGSVIMQTKQDAIVNFNFSTNSFEKNMEGAITILAENGTVKIGGQYLNTIEYQAIKDVKLPSINIQSKANDYGQYQGSMSNHDKVIDNVIKHLQGKENIMTNAFEGKKVVEMIEMMYGIS